MRAYLARVTRELHGFQRESTCALAQSNDLQNVTGLDPKTPGITWWVNVCTGLAGCAPVYLSIFEITVYFESEYREILDSDKTRHEIIVPIPKI